VGHITKMIAAIEGRTTTYVYDYDLAGRLTDVARDGVKIAHYDYDSNGNRVAYQGQNRTLRARYDAQDRLIQYGDAVYRHTANGEWAAKTINGKTTNYEYDAFGNLRAATVADATKIEYLIDGMNRRTGKKVNGTLVQGILYEDRLRPIAELDGQNDVVSRFIYATRVNVPDYMEKGGKTYRIITDHLGSPRLVIDVVTGEPIQMMDYDEFGNVLRDTNPGFQPFGFAGGIYDVHTGLIHFGARDYDGETGRWTTRDPILFAGGSTQLYEYCFGDPINYRDPSGLWTYGVGVGASGGGPGASFGIQGSYTVDSQGNGAFVLAVGAGPGVGVGGSVGVTITGSNAPSVTDLSGPFTEIGGVTGPVSVSGFRGDSEHGPVTGGTFTLGPGVGAAGWGQETFTWVGRPFKPPTCFWGENPPPGGQLSDPSGRDWHGPVPVPAPTPTP